MKSWNLKFVIGAVFLTGFLFGVDEIVVNPFFLPAPTRGQIVTSGAQRPEDSNLIVLVDDPTWRSTILAARPEVFDRSTGVIVMLPGMGGNVAQWGVTATSTITFANSMIKEGLYPIVMEHPVYFGARNSNADPGDRIMESTRYMRLNDQMQHLTDTLIDLIDRLPRDEHGMPTKKLWIMGRSNGMNRIMQWLDEIPRGGSSFEAYLASHISGVLLAGVVSPHREHFDVWRGVEHREVSDAPESIDVISMFLDHLNTSQMRWATARPFVQVPPSPFRTPPIVAMISAQDAYLPPELQIEAITSFAGNHPDSSVTMLLTPGRHDPTASFEYDILDPNTGQVIRRKIKQGRLVREVVRDHLLTERPHQSGLHRVVLEGYEQAPRCETFLHILANRSRTIIQ